MTLFTRAGGAFKVEPVHILADDERSVAIQRVTASREGTQLDTQIVQVFEIRDGKVYEVTEYAAEPSLIEAFWS